MIIKEFLKDKILENKLEYIPNSFDVIGSICVIEIKDEVKKYEKKIAESIIELNKSIKSVFKRIGARKGKHRIYKLKLIGGENNKIALHKENGVLFKLDVEKCYFSPRLCNERLRISRLVKKNESVLVMFSGVGPYIFVILKNSIAKEVYGIEINKTCHKYALENLKLNKIDENKIKLFNSDVKKILPKLNKKFDRILMPLPKESMLYLDLAVKKIKKDGIIHLYTFIEEDGENELKKEIGKHIKKFKILNIVKCGVYGPRIFRACVDIKVL